MHSRLGAYPQGPLWSHHQESVKKTSLLAASLPRPVGVDGGKGFVALVIVVVVVVVVRSGWKPIVFGDRPLR